MDPPNSCARLTGEVVYLYAYDIAYEMDRAPIRELLGQPVTQFSLDISRRGHAICSSISRRWCGWSPRNTAVRLVRCWSKRP